MKFIVRGNQLGHRLSKFGYHAKFGQHRGRVHHLHLVHIFHCHVKRLLLLLLVNFIHNTLCRLSVTVWSYGDVKHNLRISSLKFYLPATISLSSIILPHLRHGLGHHVIYVSQLVVLVRVNF